MVKCIKLLSPQRLEVPTPYPPAALANDDNSVFRLVATSNLLRDGPKFAGPPLVQWTPQTAALLLHAYAKYAIQMHSLYHRQGQLLLSLLAVLKSMTTRNIELIDSPFAGNNLFMNMQVTVLCCRPPQYTICSPRGHSSSKCP